MGACVALLPWHTAVGQTARTWNTTSGTWNATTSWDGGTAAGTSDIAYFSGSLVGSSNVTALLEAGKTVTGLSFNSAGTTTLRSNGSTARTLTTGTSGIAVNSGAGAVTIGVTGSMVSLILNGTQTFTNNSSSLLSILGGMNTAGSVGSELTIAGSGSTTFSGAISGAAGRVISLRKTGAGVLTLSGANTFSGGFTLDGGTVVVGSATALGATASTLTINGGTLDTVAGGIGMTGNIPQTWANNFAFAGSGTLNMGTGAVSMTASRTIDVQASIFTVGGAISGAGFGLTKNGGGALRLNGINTFSGGVTLNSGTLLLGNNAALGTGTFTIANAGVTIDAATTVSNTSNNNAQAWNGNFTFVGTNTLNLGTGAVAMNASRTVTVSGSALTVGGVISGAGFGLTKEGTGNLILGGANTFTGPVTINSGTLTVTSAIGNGGTAGGLGASTSDAANLVINGGVFAWRAATAGTSDRGITIGPNGGTIWQDSSGNSTILTLTGPLAYSGNGARTIGLQLTTGRSGQWNADIADAPGGATSLAVTGGAGSDEWLLPGNITMTGNITVGPAAGLQVSGTSLTSYGGVVSVGAGGYFALNSTGAAPVNITNNGQIQSYGASTNATYTGVISGTGSAFLSNGSSITTFANTGNSYTGATTVRGSPVATLRVTKLADGGVNSSIGASSNAAENLVLEAGDLTYIGAGDSTDRQFTISAIAGQQNIGRLTASGSGAVQFTSSAPVVWRTTGTTGSLTLQGTNTGNNLLAAAIPDVSGSQASLTKSGVGTWLISGNSTYTGTTGVTAGSLFVNGNQSSATGAVSVAAGATLGGSGTIGGATTFSGASLLRPGSIGTDTGVLGFGSALTLSTTGTTFIDVTGPTRGTLYDGVDVTGAVTYGGRLQFSIASADSATYDIFNFASQAGNFSSVSGAIGATSLTFTNAAGVWTAPFTVGATSGTATFTQATGELVIVPEPGTLALAGIGISAAVYCLCRRR